MIESSTEAITALQLPDLGIGADGVDHMKITLLFSLSLTR